MATGYWALKNWAIGSKFDLLISDICRNIFNVANFFHRPMFSK